MKDRQMNRALACVGAVVGAGFASGREIMVFFSGYGWFSWVLILLATGTMSVLCALVMHKLVGCGGKNWCSLYEGHGRILRYLGDGCVFLLMGITGGAMISASGELIALLLPIHYAYEAGVLGSLLVAWLMSQRSFKPLAVISAVLTCAILLSYVLVMASTGRPEGINMQPQLTPQAAVRALISALAYAGMNMTIALGVVCGCANTTPRRRWRTSVLFGIILTALLFVSNYLFMQHEDLQSAAFPIVQLLSGFGTTGYYLSVTLLYLAVLTTLIAIMCTIRSMVKTYVTKAPIQHLITIAVPLLFSMIGFETIVERVYAPIGMCCLLLIFIPMLWKRRKKPV